MCVLWHWYFSINNFEGKYVVCYIMHMLIDYFLLRENLLKENIVWRPLSLVLKWNSKEEYIFVYFSMKPIQMDKVYVLYLDLMVYCHMLDKHVCTFQSY